MSQSNSVNSSPSLSHQKSSYLDKHEVLSFAHKLFFIFGKSKGKMNGTFSLRSTLAYIELHNKALHAAPLMLLYETDSLQSKALLGVSEACH